ncbi:MAG: hypothetical protein ACM3L8_00650, partial [Verrucomicrobiota bacterium]
FEAVWIRRITLAIGSSPVSFALVSSAAILGIGAGAYAWPRARRARTANPFLPPALAETAFGAASWLFLAFGPVGLPALAACAVLSGAVLTCADAAREAGTPDGDFSGPGPFFGVNVLGAGVGAGAGGLLALPGLGMKGTAQVALFASLASASLYLAAAFARRAGARAGERRAGRERGSSTIPALLTGVTGATALGTEVLWGRWISQMAGSSAYTYFIVLAVTILAFGAGCLTYRARQGAAGARAGTVRLFTGLSVVYPAVALAVLLALGDRGTSVVRWLGGARGALQAATLGVTVLVLFPILFSSGRYFAAAVGGAVSGSVPDYGTCVLANCAGSGAGAMLVPFLLVPRLGTGMALAALCAVNLLPAWRLSAGPPPRPYSPQAAAALLPAAACLGLFALFLSGRPAVFSLPAGIAAHRGGDGGREGPPRAAGAPAFFREGPYSTVAVEGAPGREALLVDGKPESHAVRDRPTQTMLSELPFLLRGESFRRVLLVGLGSGATLRGILRHPVVRVDCAEISPEVVAAAREAFGPASGAALRDPRVRIMTGDGRRFLRATTERYDLIVSQPSNPWVMGSASLFTREAFLEMASALAPGGEALVWFQTYGVSSLRLGAELETLQSVFPCVLCFSFSPGDVLFLCSRTPSSIDLAGVRRTMETAPGIREELAAAELAGPADLLGAFFGSFRDGDAPANGSGPALRNTDDRPVLEYEIAASIGDRDPYPAYGAIARPLPEREDCIRGLPPKGSAARGRLMIEWGESASRRGFARFSEEPFLEALDNIGESARVYNDLGVVRADGRDYIKAVEYFRRALAVDPGNRSARANLAALGRDGIQDAD